MPTFYSILQYLPDPTTGERINVGMIAIGDETVGTRFVDSWDRIKCFAGDADIRFLVDFASKMEGAELSQLGLPGLEVGDALTLENLNLWAGEWREALQFTPPTVSLQSPADLLTDLAPRFLRLSDAPETGIVRSGTRARGRHTAARLAHQAVLMGVTVQELDLTVERQGVLPGVVGSAQFDSVALNGRPVLAAQGLSFEPEDSDQIERAIEALGHKIWNVREAYPSLEVGVVTLRRSRVEKADLYDRAVEIFTYHGATVVNEHEAQSWAVEAAGRYREGVSARVQIVAELDAA
jgi:hypothetical protein